MIRHRLLIATFCAALAGPAAAETTLSPDQARIAAARLIAAGQPRAGLELVTVLLQRDPEDTTSLMLKARALRTIGALGPARAAAAEAWRHAGSGEEKFGAALTQAQVLSTAGAKTRAQFWLRRAAHVAPNDVMRARAVRDFHYVRMTNPLSVSLSFGITPTDNVNNAPRDNTMVLGGLVFVDPSAVPLSGVEFSGSVAVRRNFAISRTSRNFVGFRWDERAIAITDDTVPAGVEASDFAYRKLEFSLGRDFVRGPEAPRNTATVSAGRIWYGGTHLSDEVRLVFRQVAKRPRDRSFVWDATLGYSERMDNSDRSGFTGTLGGRWSRVLAGGGRLSWSAEVSRTATDSAALTHTGAELGVSYTLPKPVLGAVAQVSVTGEVRQYDDPLYIAEPRSDTSGTLALSLLFKDHDVYGFAPKVTLSATRTESNVTRFETESLGISIGIQSVF